MQKSLLLALCICSIAVADLVDAIEPFGLSLRYLLYLAFTISSTALIISIQERKLFSAKVWMPTTVVGASTLTLLVFLFLTTVARFFIDFYDLETILFVIRRILSITFFLFVFMFAIVVGRNSPDSLFKNIATFTIAAGSASSLVALIDYLSVRNGIEIDFRNAMGTSYGEIFDRFYYYGYHRALGLNREPSLLCAYLIPIFFTACLNRQWIAASLIATAIYSTLSLIGLAVVTLTVLSVTAIQGWRISFDWQARVLGSLVIGIFVGDLIVFPYEGVYKSYFMHRIDLILGAQNLPEALGDLDDRQLPCTKLVQFSLSWLCDIPGRGDVFRYLHHEPVPIFGVGLGFANLRFGEFLGIERPASLLSVAVTVLVAGGPLSLLLLFACFALLTIRILNFLWRLPKEAIAEGVGCVMVVVSCCLILVFLLEQPNAIIALCSGLAMGRMLRLETEHNRL